MVNSRTIINKSFVFNKSGSRTIFYYEMGAEAISGVGEGSNIREIVPRPNVFINIGMDNGIKTHTQKLN